MKKKFFLDKLDLKDQIHDDSSQKGSRLLRTLFAPFRKSLEV
jgi:hypothetical protein